MNEEEEIHNAGNYISCEQKVSFKKKNGDEFIQTNLYIQFTILLLHILNGQKCILYNHSCKKQNF